MKEMNIEFCNIKSGDSVHLANVLDATQLLTLRLEGNPIGSGVDAFAKMLERNICLKMSDLRDASVNDKVP